MKMNWGLIFIVLLTIGSIRYLEPFSAGENSLIVNYQNNHNIDDVKLTMWIPELGYYAQTGRFGMDDDGSKIIPFDIDEQGSYLAKITVTSDDGKKSKFVWLDVY